MGLRPLEGLTSHRPPACRPAWRCRQEAEAVFEQVCQLEASFWQMAYSTTKYE